MRHFESVLIARPNLPDSDLDTLIGKIKGDLESTGPIHEFEVNKWGKRSLAYPIEKTKEGVYFVLTYQSEDGKCVDAMEKKLRINDQILRFLTVRLDDEMRTEGKLRQRFKVKEAPKTEAPKAEASEAPAEKPAEEPAKEAETADTTGGE